MVVTDRRVPCFGGAPVRLRIEKVVDGSVFEEDEAPRKRVHVVHVAKLRALTKAQLLARIIDKGC